MKSLFLKEIYYSLNLDKYFSKRNDRQFSNTLLKDIYKKYSGKKIIVAGNGPSLLKTDLSLIDAKRDEFVVLASNGFYLYTEEYNVKADILAVEDPYPAEDMKSEIINYDCFKIIPFDLINIIKPDNKKITYVDFRRRLSLNKYRGFKFGNDLINGHFYWGWTVTYLLLQIAASLKPKSVFLVGCDLNYKVDIKDKVGRNTFLSEDDDINHFSPNYFKNRRWHDPKVEKMHQAFNKANYFYRKLNIPLFNCSPDTKITSIKKLDWKDIFDLNE